MRGGGEVIEVEGRCRVDMVMYRNVHSVSYINTLSTSFFFLQKYHTQPMYMRYQQNKPGTLLGV